MGWRRHSTKEQMRIFGQRVRRFRIMAGMTQAQLAKAMRTCLRTVQNIEWANNEPRYSTINKFNRLEKMHVAAKAMHAGELKIPVQDSEIGNMHV